MILNGSTVTNIDSVPYFYYDWIDLNFQQNFNERNVQIFDTYKLRIGKNLKIKILNKKFILKR